jgi:hypothetical protein
MTDVSPAACDACLPSAEALVGIADSQRGRCQINIPLLESANLIRAQP